MRNTDESHAAFSRVVTLAAGLLAFFFLAAAPALAVQAPTGLKETSPLGVLTYGETSVITAVLVDATQAAVPVAIGGQQVNVEMALADGPWSYLATVTTDSAQYSTGEYALLVTPSQSTFYRFVFAGSADYAPVTSEAFEIGVKPVIGKPSVPRRATRTKRFTVTGVLAPQFPAGGKTIAVKAYRYANQKWKVCKKWTAVNASTATGSTYSARALITRPGTYRFKAFSAESAQWAAGRTGWSQKLTVK